MDQKIISLYDRFTHGGMNRREFLDRLAELAGSSAAAVALLPLLQNNYAQAAIVAPDDRRLVSERVSYESPKGKINGYLVRAKAADAKDLGKRPAVIVIHENRGLNPHIEDIARRLAVEGYLAFAPDLLSVNGGTPPEEDRARELHQKTEREDMIAAALAAIPFMQKHAESTGKVGAVGFCFGGGVVNRMAAGSPDLGAAVPYYGVQIPVETVPAIKAPLLLQYAENDENINKGIAAVRDGAGRQQQEIRHLHLSRHAARLQQRHRRRPLQQGGGRAGLDPHARVLRREFGRAAEGELIGARDHPLKLFERPDAPWARQLRYAFIC